METIIEALRLAALTGTDVTLTGTQAKLLLERLVARHFREGAGAPSAGPGTGPLPGDPSTGVVMLVATPWPGASPNKTNVDPDEGKRAYAREYKRDFYAFLECALDESSEDAARQNRRKGYYEPNHIVHYIDGVEIGRGPGWIDHPDLVQAHQRERLGRLVVPSAKPVAPPRQEIDLEATFSANLPAVMQAVKRLAGGPYDAASLMQAIGLAPPPGEKPEPYLLVMRDAEPRCVPGYRVYTGPETKRQWLVRYSESAGTVEWTTFRDDHDPITKEEADQAWAYLTDDGWNVGIEAPDATAETMKV